ncbi:MAG TPA: cupin domain-containing protein [Streptosporangiaceae bacterium]|jgi:mannose-6-phosphate isomerase-like protein (cupin superfamily)
MTRQAVVRAGEVPAEPVPGGGTVRTLLDAGADGGLLARRLIELPLSAEAGGTGGGAGELWFVISGSGRLDVEGHPGLSLSPDRGVWIPAGATYRLQSEGPAQLRMDAVTLPSTAGEAAGQAGPAAGTQADATPGQPAGTATAPMACDFRDCAVETTGDRQFRVLFGPGQGCEIATQFVGEIPPGRAPEHSHPYDEVVLILAGEGVVHAGGQDHALSPGTCTHLPPGQLHCLENAGQATLRVLGVFHPANSPAAKLEKHG